MASAIQSINNIPASTTNGVPSRKRTRDSLSSGGSTATAAVEIPQILVTVPKSAPYGEGDAGGFFEVARTSSSYSSTQAAAFSAPKTEAESRVEHMVSGSMGLVCANCKVETDM